MRSRFEAVVLTAAMLAGASVSAQESAPSAWDAPGARVRLRTDTARGTVTGVVVERGDGTLGLRLKSGERVDVPLASIERLEHSLGRRTPAAVQAAWLGLGVGLGAAVATARVDRDDCGITSDNACSRKGAIGTGLLVSLLFLGLAEPPTVERWETVAGAGRRAQWTIAPRMGDGVGLEVGLRF
ncbi:MAG: hypothetical protein ABW221_09205 [Vicinamibacteria bacterium]